MNAITAISIVFLSITLTLQAEDPPTALDATATRRAFEWVEIKGENSTNLLRSVGIRLGKSDYVASGPFIETFRLTPRPEGEDRTLGQIIRDTPIINVFIPEPMAKPTRTGKYFAWGEHEKPWLVLADRPIPGPQGTLLSVSR